MSHDTTEENLSPAEREYKDLIQHADDLFKIELLRPAKSWYKKALALNIENDKVMQRIAECDKLLVLERKVIFILASVATILLIIIFFS